MTTDHDQIPEPLVGGLLDSLVGAQVKDPWATIGAARKAKQSVVVADLDVDVLDVPVLTDPGKDKDGKQIAHNPAKDYALYLGHLVDQVASQVLMFRTNLEAWMLQGPGGMQALMNVTKRIQQLSTPLILETSMGGSQRQSQRQLNMLFGQNIPGVGRMGFSWVTPAWLQIPGCCHPEIVRSLVSRGFGVLLDLNWLRPENHMWNVVQSYIHTPVAPVTASGVMPLGFACDGATFSRFPRPLQVAIQQMKTAVPFLIDAEGPAARQAMAAGQEMNCPVMIGAGREWSAKWREHHDGAQRWRRLALDHILRINTELEKAP